MKSYKKLCLSILLLGFGRQLQSPPVLLENKMLKIADQAGFFNEALIDIKLAGKALVNFLKGNMFWNGIILTLDVITHDTIKNITIEQEISLYFKDPALIYGATYLVISHDHPQAQQFLTEEQKQYYTESEDIFTGSHAIHPLTGKELPIFISNYNEARYDSRASKAHLAIPAHSYGDFYFAKKYNLPIHLVITPTQHQIDVGFQATCIISWSIKRTLYCSIY